MKRIKKIVQLKTRKKTSNKTRQFVIFFSITKIKERVVLQGPGLICTLSKKRSEKSLKCNLEVQS